MSLRNLAAGYAELHQMANDPTPRVGFGIPYIDDRCNGGLGKGQVAMAMAFSHVGKTTLGLNAIHHNPGVPILKYSLEMPWDQVTCKLTSMEIGRRTADIEEDFRGPTPPDYVQQVMDKFRLLLCDDSPDLTMKMAEESYLAATELLASQGHPPPRLCIFDFLEKIQGQGLLEAAQQVDKVAAKVHTFARKMRTSVLLLHQVGKGDAGGGADLLDLGSGRYGGHQLMELVIGMSKPGARKDLSSSERERIKDQRIIQILKNRVTGQVDEGGRAHRLDPVSMRLTDWSDPVAPLWAPKAPQRPLYESAREVLGV